MSKSTDLCFNAHKIEDADKKLIESAVATNIDRGMDEESAYLAAAKERLKAFEKQLQRIEKETIAAYMAKEPEDAARILAEKNPIVATAQTKEYRYAMFNRPAGMGTIPKDGFVRSEPRTKRPRTSRWLQWLMLPTVAKSPRRLQKAWVIMLTHTLRCTLMNAKTSIVVLRKA